MLLRNHEDYLIKTETVSRKILRLIIVNLKESFKAFETNLLFFYKKNSIFRLLDLIISDPSIMIGIGCITDINDVYLGSLLDLNVDNDRMYH